MGCGDGDRGGFAGGSSGFCGTGDDGFGDGGRGEEGFGDGGVSTLGGTGEGDGDGVFGGSITGILEGSGCFLGGRGHAIGGSLGFGGKGQPWEPFSDCCLEIKINETQNKKK